jgi:SAM-dependent methyltransferase
MGQREESDPAVIMRELRTKVLVEIDRRKTQDTEFPNHMLLGSQATAREARKLETSYPYPIKPLALKIRKLIQAEIQWNLQSYLDEQRHLISGALADVHYLKTTLAREMEKVNGLLADVNDLRNHVPKPSNLVHYAIVQTSKGIFVSERIIENAFAIRSLPGNVKRILDVGCCESDLCIQLATMGFQVFGIDTSNCELTHRNFHFLRDDIRETHFQDDYFDVVMAISSIEHIGLGHYGDPDYLDGDLKAMKEIRRVLMDGGLLILSTPFGAKSTTTWERVYDNDSLAKLLEGFNVQKTDYWIKEREEWRNASPEEAKLQNHDVRPFGDDYPLWPCIVTLTAKKASLDK